jgi:hypothetical protein
METADEGSAVLESCIATVASLEPKALQQFLSVLTLEGPESCATGNIGPEPIPDPRSPIPASAAPFARYRRPSAD